MKFWQVDSFTQTPFRGNPAAVFVLDALLPDSLLREIAREMNLSETAFVLRTGESWNLRWLTPNSEVDLCGHATLAAAHILWSQGFELRDTIQFSTRSGLLTARKDKRGITLNFPLQPARAVEPSPLPLGSGGTPIYYGSNGNDALVIFRTEDEVRAFAPDYNAIRRLPERGLLITALSSDPRFDYVYRAFFPKLQIPEDPVTGSANTLLAPLWAERLGKSNLTAYQASERGGELQVALADDRVAITGACVTVFEGDLMLGDSEKAQTDQATP